ncbi:hypothetical protein RAN53_09325 [Halomonas sp. SSL-5]|uniref:hypothetical protein n=1 Tax=Halomonas sp. SSL-5 TaxID=3065855 RepID=UPI0027385F27|nr:hypothetical protein [Halomonas sp. SSL-5]MDY7116550.1 hypothetical protein [Halomonas sp. SSL-5]
MNYDPSDHVECMLCARIDELEREKEVLATQLDRAEERIDSLSKQANALHRIASTLDLWSQAGTNVSIDAVAEAAAKRVEELVTTAALAEDKLAMLRGQADALHRIGSALDLDPGADLTREAQAKVEALLAHMEWLDGLRRNVIEAIRDDRFEDLDVSFYRDDKQPPRPTTSLARMKDERAQAIQKAVHQARMEWAKEDKAALDRLIAENVEASLGHVEALVEAGAAAADAIAETRRLAEGGDHD